MGALVKTSMKIFSSSSLSDNTHNVIKCVPLLSPQFISLLVLDTLYKSHLKLKDIFSNSLKLGLLPSSAQKPTKSKSDKICVVGKDISDKGKFMKFA